MNNRVSSRGGIPFRRMPNDCHRTAFPAVNCYVRRDVDVEKDVAAFITNIVLQRH